MAKTKDEMSTAITDVGNMLIAVSAGLKAEYPDPNSEVVMGLALTIDAATEKLLKIDD